MAFNCVSGQVFAWLLLPLGADHRLQHRVATNQAVQGQFQAGQIKIGQGQFQTGLGTHSAQGHLGLTPHPIGGLNGGEFKGLPSEFWLWLDLRQGGRTQFCFGHCLCKVSQSGMGKELMQSNFALSELAQLHHHLHCQQRMSTEGKEIAFAVYGLAQELMPEFTNAFLQAHLARF